MKPCGVRLDCGHVCRLACHACDIQHKEYKCNKPCERIPCVKKLPGHKCFKRCHEDCGQCKIEIDKVLPQCGHTQKVPCHLDPTEFSCGVACSNVLDCFHGCAEPCGLPHTTMCQAAVIVGLPCGHERFIRCCDRKQSHTCLEPCSVLLACGHGCDRNCGDKHTTACRVQITRELPCGHKCIVSCYRKDYDDVQCPKACRSRLECDHVCSGTCGECFEGRLHKMCKQERSRVLVCGHECKQPCSSAFNECDKACENRCVHSKCSKKCGELCVPCQKPCQWKCRHFKCSKKCSEPCDRQRCNEPCPKTLKCGHYCIGLCGDKCPTKCRVCDEEEVTQIMFGNEGEPDARFVELKDCGHILEVTALDKWMDMATNTSECQAVQLKSCPLCKTAIRRNLRYGSIINKSLADIERVKVKSQPSHDNFDERVRSLLEQIRNMQSSKFGRLFKAYLSFIDGRVALLSNIGSSEKLVAAAKLVAVENTFCFLKPCSDLIYNLRLFNKSKGLADVPKLLSHVASLQKALTRFCRWIGNSFANYVISGQQIKEGAKEIERMQTWFNVLKCRKDRLDVPNTEKKLVELAKGRITTEEEIKKLKDLIKRLKRGIGFTEAERVEIVTAMGMAPGHWYTCPNGHIYAIGNCGGAMMESKCPECKTVIGGGNHRLADGNRHSSVMDGSRHAAWSEQANLANFDLRGVR